MDGCPLFFKKDFKNHEGIQPVFLAGKFIPAFTAILLWSDFRFTKQKYL